MSKSTSAAAYRIPMEVRSIRVIGWGSAASSYPSPSIHIIRITSVYQNIPLCQKRTHLVDKFIHCIACPHHHHNNSRSVQRLSLIHISEPTRH